MPLIGFDWDEAVPARGEDFASLSPSCGGSLKSVCDDHSTFFFRRLPEPGLDSVVAGETRLTVACCGVCKVRRLSTARDRKATFLFGALVSEGSFGGVGGLVGRAEK